METRRNVTATHLQILQVIRLLSDVHSAEIVAIKSSIDAAMMPPGQEPTRVL